MTRKKTDEEERSALSPEQWALVQANLKIVDDVGLRHFPQLAKTQPHYLRSLGTPGLEHAVRTFDPARGSLRNHAWMRIRGAILDGLAQDGPCVSEAVKRAMSAGMDFAACQAVGPHALDDTDDKARERFRGALGGFVASWKIGWVFGGRGDDAETPLRRAARLRIEEEALAMSETLPERERRMMHLRYRDGRPWHEVAAILGMAESTLFNHHHALMERLARRMLTKKVDPVD
jgi:RNA polymerase sigma factor (sigma-70 family)